MTTRGADSAYGPTTSQAMTAMAAGVNFWGLYAAGPGALHNWTVPEIAVLRDLDIVPLPIYVPRLDLTTDPVSDARVFVSALQSLDLYGVGVLDTEASMRGNPRLAGYEAAFGDTLVALGYEAVTYAGGFTLSSPPKHTPWWIINMPPPPGVCYQTGQTLYGGLLVDTDLAGDGFPLGSWSPPPPPVTEENKDMITAVTDPNGAQRHVYVLNTDQSVTHYWQDVNVGSWHRETLPTS